MIRITGLSFQYGGGEKNALSDIDLEINNGDFLGIIGSSGAGKSTLTYAMNGLAPHHFRGDFRGEVTVNGLDTRQNQPEELARHVGSVFQDIDSQMLASVVEDEILFGLENFGIPHDEIERRMNDALESTGISELRSRTVASLSGGQKQKAAIAAIVALRPSIMVLDEPTGELDPQSSRMVFEILKKLNEEHGVTIVLVEQKIMLLCEFARRLAVMDGGKLILCGPVKDVLDSADRLEDAGVNIPRVATLARRLRERELYHGDIPLDIGRAKIMVEGILSDAAL
ncbi:MAG: ATP-binding cassette domain-containing protein [Synergistaceae bacterium]|jgi:energy-coupling factor transport system ATP-binding protein|nr:ATP-binding cassette domain-containing protein [Synergistaceae bacterium]